ncbi:MAG: bifunctional molybdenum cofactor biosynthesis protein MoaC/MoaB [Candidatus Hydrogenedentota bacterium]|nr:MAG: bifunctional molybdenum cofactor biosynthesis protein MoaC/MoaB [Candidatus Hydrogenedentota bacterium]
MIDVSSKQVSLRYAKAKGEVHCDPSTIDIIENNKLPKGNLFDVAKAAGLLAAKNTSHLIPHCHPVQIDMLEFTFSADKKGIVTIEAEAKAIDRTGIEMEVLTAVSVAALTIYDLLKPVDKSLSIQNIMLLEKKGGRSDKRFKVKESYKAAVLVCSDSCAAGKREDKSGKVIKQMLEEAGVEVVDYQIIPDDPEKIKSVVQSWVEKDIPFIFTTGGTGLSPRDNTVDTITEMLEQEVPGIAERMRILGGMRTPLAMLSRGVAGSIQKSLIVTLPGSSAGARESLEALIPGIFHARKMLLGGGH